ncbi:adenine deaminase [Lachnobacterium bovis]|uniref:adenine deaminase n=1 Tax=Lachnobacterium bovis TaxID=140626 RepID=UPI0009DFCB1A|nr:adenine deaminase [Lachnobacterium bovis]
MSVQKLKNLIVTAERKEEADLLIKNSKLVNVLTGEIYNANIVVTDGIIVDIEENVEEDINAKKVIDAKGSYAIPGLIEGHIHIESSFVTPEEFSRLVVPHGTTTVVADPHEIVNVCGKTGMKYMLDASELAALDIKYMIPSCVPATQFENNGAILDAEGVRELLEDDRILGLGEFMNAPGVCGCDEEVLKKIQYSKDAKVSIDGHAPGMKGSSLSAYIAAGIETDHECQTVEEMQERLRKGMYVLLRQGSACKDLRNLLKGVTPQNSRRCLLCSDDRQPVSILKKGDLDEHLRICVEENIDPIIAIQMATLNAAECYGLRDRGAIAVGKRADICIVDDLKEFKMLDVFINGKHVAHDGKYLCEVKRLECSNVEGSVNVKDFSIEKLRIEPRNQRVIANTIDITPGSIVTSKGQAYVKIDENGDFEFDEKDDVAKVAVIERHHGTGNIGVGYLRGFGIKHGAIASTIAHDSHNIIVIGTSNQEIEYAVNKLIEQEGGVVVTKNNQICDSISLKVGGLMSEESGEIVMDKLDKLYETMKKEVGVKEGVDGVMSLAFMALSVIPEIKITDMGLFDVTKFEFIPAVEEINLNIKTMIKFKTFANADVDKTRC